jgi:SAM-dependent methyltransferase
MQLTTQDLYAALSKVQAAHHSRIGHNDQLFLERIYGGGLDKYTDRLKAIGFTGHQHLLDAGCGYGQWSLALAGMNLAVSSCDISRLRIDFLGDLTQELGVANLDFRVGGIDNLPYENESFDAIFSYSVIQLTPWRKSLADFARVLKPGGTLYINANAVGWYLHLWADEPNRADDYDPKAIAARTFADTLRYDRDGIYEPGMNLIIEPQTIKEELQRLNFTGIQIASEGCLSLNPDGHSPKPFFKGEYKGQVGIYEVVATRG